MPRRNRDERHTRRAKEQRELDELEARLSEVRGEREGEGDKQQLTCGVV